MSPDLKREPTNAASAQEDAERVDPWALDSVPNEAGAADFDLFRDRLRGHYYPARVEPLDGRGQMWEPRLAAVELHHLTIGYVRFGTAVSIDAGDLLAYHVDVPLSGTVLSQCGDETTLATPQRAAVFSPRRHTMVHDWGREAAQLLIKISRRSVEHELEGLLGRAVNGPIQFQMAMPISEGPGRTWGMTLASLLARVNADPLLSPAARRHIELLERSMISGLLLSQPHSFTSALQDDTDRWHHDAVDRVVDLIRASPEKPFSLADLCRAGSLSARGLQVQFQQRLGVSPMQYLRQVRLDQARAALRSGQASVSDVAYDAGFSNVGRFARAYRLRFGELPSETCLRVNGRLS